jgi:probable addiction module antidote protein
MAKQAKPVKQKRVFPPSVSHDVVMRKMLRDDPEFAMEYLKVAFEDKEVPSLRLLALRRVADAYGMARLAKAAGLQRESLYRALSVKGNPTFSTINAVLSALGATMTIRVSKSSARHWKMKAAA